MKAYEELENIFGDSDRPPTSSDLHEMRYLEMVLKETLRLYPIGPILMRQLEGDVRIRDFVLPTGCSVAVFLYRTQRNPQFFPEPDKFDPDRFLPENSANIVPYSYLPFSGGPRKCIGNEHQVTNLICSFQNMCPQI
ncbi:hypothetical protein L9F63_003909 [Diploptera punctata]|uniref:Cytochrome P450 n=1 Tax=Diploptera punctata TaxID=6984 RepID=A0AAD7ZJG7_DIPPU|nr:hypothetical protein L9F63_003909 [Diploptera punctata]